MLASPRNPCYALATQTGTKMPRKVRTMRILKKPALRKLAKRSSLAASCAAVLAFSTGCDRSDKEPERSPPIVASSAFEPDGFNMVASARGNPGGTSIGAAVASGSVAELETAGVQARLSIELDSPAIDLGPSARVALGGGFVMAADVKGTLKVWPKAGDSLAPMRYGSFYDQTGSRVAVTTGLKTHAYVAAEGALLRWEVGPEGTTNGYHPISIDAAGLADVEAANVLQASESGGSAAAKPKELGVAVYIAKPVPNKSLTKAKLWVEGQRPVLVSTGPGGATSASLVRLDPRRFLILTLDGRPETSPIHAIPLEVDESGRAVLGEDRVVYSAGPSQRRTKLHGLLIGANPFAVLPTWRTPQDFGLLVFRVGADPETAIWVDYPGTIEPAAADTATICGLPVVAFVHPETSERKASHVLEMGWLNERGELQDRRILATEKKIVHVALGEEGAGGWVVYTTPDGLRGRRIACR